ncbi:hypothetical protein NXS19_003947 [Fusarium pseudograminearum]|nr:hypothetical protein NXS19_003947 [Fusarium pseudograminearum]
MDNGLGAQVPQLVMSWFYMLTTRDGQRVALCLMLDGIGRIRSTNSYAGSIRSMVETKLNSQALVTYIYLVLSFLHHPCHHLETTKLASNLSPFILLAPYKTAT